MRSPGHILFVACLWLAGAVAACAPASNQWVLSEVRPAGAPFPFSGVQLKEGGRYEAEGLFDANGDYAGRTQTIEGQYSWRRGRLSMRPESGPTVTYKTRRRLDGSLVMTLDVPGQERKIKAVMRPVPQPAMTPDRAKWTESSTFTSPSASPPRKPSTASGP